MSLADKDAWLFAVIRSPTLTAAAKNVAALLYLHHNSKSGKLALFHDTVATESGLAWDTVRKRISDLIGTGFVEADGTAWNTGRKGANRYRLTFPGSSGGASTASSSQVSTASPGTSVPQQAFPLASSSQGDGAVAPGSLAQPCQGIIEQGSMNVEDITLSSEEDRSRQPAIGLGAQPVPSVAGLQPDDTSGRARPAAGQGWSSLPVGKSQPAQSQKATAGIAGAPPISPDQGDLGTAAPAASPTQPLLPRTSHEQIARMMVDLANKDIGVLSKPAREWKPGEIRGMLEVMRKLCPGWNHAEVTSDVVERYVGDIEEAQRIARSMVGAVEPMNAAM
jgi:hypothetical protein